MGHVEIRTRLAGSILFPVALTNLATEIINIMKEHVTAIINSSVTFFVTEKRHKNVTQLK